MKQKMHILYVPGTLLGFKSITAATTAMTALSKGTALKHDSDYRDYVTSDDEENRLDAMSLTVGLVAQPEKKKPLGLPAPKRNTVPCPVCENVQVVRGTNCQSCGKYVSLMSK